MNGRKLINGAGNQLLAATALCAFSVVAPQFAQAQALNQRVLIVYNSNDADSTSVANFYATQRGIPAANLCPITPSSTTLVGFAEYLSAVKAPVQNCLNALGQTNILYIVFTYNTPYDLLAPDQAVYSLDEFVADIWDVYAPVGQYGLPPSPQPYFTAAQAEGNVYTPFVSLATFRTQNPVPIYAVWRLDAPTPTLAKGLVTKAMTAEASGLAGKVCVDETTATRSYDYDITAPDWDLHSFALLAGLAGFSVTEDQNSAEFGTAPAPLRCDGAALYSGWYSFNNYNNAFSFNTGAIGYHLDSAAAADPRGGTNWSANALLNGITATHGAVAEPFVTGWSKPDGVFRNLFEGANLGDAFLRNNFYLKWMMLNIGDPLYRPFPSGFPAVTAPQNSFEVNPQYLIGGTGSTGKITLAAAPSSDLVFTLTADQPSIATVPSTVTVHAGQTTATFPIATNAVLQDSPLLITAASSTVTLTNTLIPQNVLAMLFVAPLSVGGGASAVGTVYLNENAPANGITINLSSDNPAATVPTTVTVPAGTNILTFNITTAPVSSDTSADITASYFGATQTASFTIASSGPIVSAVTVTNIGSTTATVNWTTNVPSSAQVSYGTSTAYGSQSTLDNTLVTAHSVTLTGLSASFTYHFRVTSVDSQGRPGSSGDNVFTTTGGLIGYWNFDEGTGTIAHDTSGSGYNATVNGATWVSGKINSALSFNGSTNVLTPNIGLGTTFSISAWVNPSATQGGYVRIAETQYNGGLYLGTDLTGAKFKFIVNTGAGATGNCGAGFGCAEGGSITSGWHLVTATFDGTSGKLYLDGSIVASDTFTAPAITNFPLYIGTYYGGGSGWKGSIDDVRLYSRALTSTEVAGLIGPPDTTPPTVPLNVLATAFSISQINVAWSASTDNVGVAGYRILRNGTQVGSTTTALSYSDTGLTPSTQYTYTVVAFDAAGNASAPSAGSTATTLTSDTTPPSVSLTAPAQNAAVSNTVTVSATATDNVAVNDVRFQLDGVNLGADLTASPYTIQWDTTTATNGTHTLTAIAKDTSGNSATSSAITVTVNNSVTGPPTQGLIGYWNFDEGTGTIAHDTSGSGYNGTVNGAAWVAGKINGGLSFNGNTNVVTPNIALGTTFSITAWVNPSTTQSGYARIAETQFNLGFYLGVDVTGTKYKFIVNSGSGSTGNCGVSYGCAEGGTIAAGWHLVTATYDGATAKLYVDGVVIATDTFTAQSNTNLPLYIASYYQGGGGWKGSEDEVRLYNRALTSTEVSAIFNYTGSSDTTPPTVPGNVLATAVSSTQINVTWSASTDNVGVAGYRVFRNGTQVGATTTALSYSDTGLTPSTQYTYTVVAFDAAGNASAPSTGSTATTLTPDTTPPNVSITAPAQNATVSNTVTVSATATDNVAVNDVRFQLDGVNLGADLTASPYTIQWDTTTASNGTHTLTAIAKDTSGNSATSSAITVTVNNTVTGPPTQGLIGYWNFDEGAGTLAHDTSGSGYNATVNGAAWVIGKINGALSFNGSSNAVTPNISLGSTFSISAWVNPSITQQGGYVRILETQYNGGLYLGTDGTGTKYKFIVNTAMGATGNCGTAYGCAEGGTIASGWHLVTATYDGATAKLYVDGAVAASETFTAPGATNLPLYFGTYYAGGFGWKGSEDEVRLYNRALTSTEVSAIFNYTGAPDTTPPTVPANGLATAFSSTQINITWSASTDNVGVAGYRVFRNGTQVGATTTALSYSDTGLTPSTQYTYTVVAFDAAGNASAPSTGSTATTLTPDTTPPNVSITAPAQNATVSNTVTVSATATDNVAVNDVRFQLDGVNLGADLTASPYTIQWDTTTATNGTHTLTAIAKDTSGNSSTSATITVTVNNTVTGPPTQGLIGYWNLDEGAGTIAHDTSGSGYNATVNGATWVAGKINGALSFNGSSNAVTPNISLGSTFSISAWVNPSVTPQNAFVRLIETQYNGGFYLGTDVTGTKYKFIVNTAMGATGNCGAAYGCAEGGTIATGWHLVTATYDGAAAKLYVDGALMASETFTAPGTTNFPLYFGTYYGGGFGWKGSEDDVRLYNRALSATEVGNIYNANK